MKSIQESSPFKPGHTFLAYHNEGIAFIERKAKAAFSVMDYFSFSVAPPFHFTLVTQSHERMFVASDGCGTLHTALVYAGGLSLLTKACWEWLPEAHLMDTRLGLGIVTESLPLRGISFGRDSSLNIFALWLDTYEYMVPDMTATE